MKKKRSKKMIVDADADAIIEIDDFVQNANKEVLSDDRVINSCENCPVWEDWRFTLPPKKQRIPHPINGIQECENCSLKGGRV
jgi:hypothetical protein